MNLFPQNSVEGCELGQERTQLNLVQIQEDFLNFPNEQVLDLAAWLTSRTCRASWRFELHWVKFWTFFSCSNSICFSLCLQEPTTLTTRHRKRKRTTWCSPTGNTCTTGRWRQMSHRSQTTPPASPTPTSPTRTSWRTSTPASSARCSCASPVSRETPTQHVSHSDVHWVNTSGPSVPVLSFRKPGWVGAADQLPPGVCAPLWGFWWEGERVQVNRPRRRQPRQIHHQRIRQGIPARSVPQGVRRLFTSALSVAANYLSQSYGKVKIMNFFNIIINLVYFLHH